MATLGRDIWTGKTINYPERSNNCCLVVAESRSGKTIQVINIAAQLSKKKKLLVFDYGAEDWKHLGYMNFQSKDLRMRVEKYTVIPVSKIKFHISDFWKSSHWESFGLTPLAAKIVSSLAVRKDVHNNDVYLFKNMINDLPTSWQELSRFKTKYGNIINITFSLATMGALKQRLYTVFDREHFFVNAHEETFTYRELYRLLDYGHLCIDLDLAKAGSDVFWAKAIVGKILEELTHDFKKLSTYHLLMIFEEADKLLPEPQAEDGADICLSKARDFVRKHRRHNIEMIFITQDFIRIDQEIASNCPTKILGACAEQRNPYANYTKKLRFVPEENYREFLLIDENQRKGIYNPITCPTAYGRYDVDNLHPLVRQSLSSNT